MRTLSVADLRGIVTDGEELGKGTRIADGGGLANLARHGAKLYADAAGSGASPYKVTIALADADAEVKARCGCVAARSRPFCKHAAALLVAWARQPESFAASAAPPPGTEPTRKKAVKKGTADDRALMREGVERVSTLVRELAASGVATLGHDRAAGLRGLAESLREGKLRRLSAHVLDLAGMLERAASARAPLPAVEYTDLVADMLLTVRKLERHLGGEALDDRHVEELVGKTWRKTDRTPVTGLDLVEYAFVHRVTSDDFLIRESRFVDLATGGHFSEKQIIPAMIVKRTAPKPSWLGLRLEGAAGSTYPGYPPRRLDLESPGTQRPLDGATLARLLERALPGVGAAIAAFQEHRKDVFAPDLCPVAVRVDAVLAHLAQLRVIDGDGNALHLPGDAALAEQLATALRGVRLQAVLGDVGLEGALPTLFPRAVVVADGASLALRPLAGGPADVVLPGGAAAAQRGASGDRFLAAARAAGASTAAIRLAEVRGDLADGFASGLASLGPRTCDALVARLGELGLDKQAALLAAIAQRAEPAERLDDVVKLYQVLGIALVRLASATQVDRATLVAVPTYASVLVRHPDRWLDLAELAAARAEGRLGRYEAAVHVGRAIDAMSTEALAAQVYPLWADGSLSPFVARALIARGDEVAAIARHVLSPTSRAGRAAAITALRILAGLDPDAAERALRTSPLRTGAHPGADLGEEIIDDARLARGPHPVAEARRAERRRRVLAAASILATAPKKDARAQAAADLERCGSSLAWPALRLAFATDPAHAVRESAALALAVLSDAELVDRFVTLVRRRDEDEASALLAARALGILADARGIEALLDAFSGKWKPGPLAEALRVAGVVAFAPLLDRVERDATIASRAAAQTYVATLPEPVVVAALRERIDAAIGAKGFLGRARMWIRLTSEGADAVRAQLQAHVVALMDAGRVPADAQFLLDAAGRTKPRA